MSRILVVEDDLDVGRAMRSILSLEGHHVDSASCLADARQLIELRRYDLVLADWLLPDGSGLALAGEAEAKGIRALVITGYVRGFPPEAFYKCEFLVKPVRAAELVKAVTEHLARPA